MGAYSPGMDHERNRALVQRFITAYEEVRILAGAGPSVPREDLAAAFDELDDAEQEWRRSLGV